MGRLTFNEDEHRYYLDGRHIPGVNEILRAEGVLPDFGPNSEYAKLLGKYTHQAIALLLKDNLREDSLSPEIAVRIAQFKRFQQQVKITPKIIETPLAIEKWYFAGTPDLITANILLDWKISQNLYDYFSLTMAGYEILYEEFLGNKPEEIWIVRLLPSDYKIDKIKTDRQNFLAILLTYKYKKERGLL